MRHLLCFLRFKGSRVVCITMCILVSGYVGTYRYSGLALTTQKILKQVNIMHTYATRRWHQRRKKLQNYQRWDKCLHFYTDIDGDMSVCGTTIVARKGSSTWIKAVVVGVSRRKRKSKAYDEVRKKVNAVLLKTTTTTGTNSHRIAEI